MLRQGQDLYQSKMSGLGRFIDQAVPQEKFVRVFPGQTVSQVLGGITRPFMNNIRDAAMDGLGSLMDGQGIEKAF